MNNPLPRRPLPVDGCPHPVDVLVATVLPADMRRLRECMASATPMAAFGCQDARGQEPPTRSGTTADFPGCYVLIDEYGPVYVGISRKVFSRLRQHVRGKTHFDATLAYRMATRRTGHTMRRSAAMEDAAFLEQFAKAKSDIGRMKVAFIEIEDPLERHMFEAYAAQELGTGEWNSFETH
jgi:predicted GIY-YIG superfamily endonuclease